MPILINLIGMRFGRLVVLKHVGKNKYRSSLWICKCDCGTITHPISSTSLRRGNTQSCGCYKKDRMFEANKKYNRYDLTKDFGIGYTNKGEEFYFDLENYDLIKNYCWHLKPDGYVVSDHLKMHRLILGITKHPEILTDHENRNRKDNRKSNLRIATPRQNTTNRGLQRNNDTGVVGVHPRNDYDGYNKWRSKIECEGKAYNLGTFDTFEEAVITRLKAEKEMFGDFAPQKHLYEQYNII